MTHEIHKEELLYLHVHGLQAQAPETLNEAMAQAISSMRRSVYAESARELSEAEAEVLRSGGAVLEEQPGPDPMKDLPPKARHYRLGAAFGESIFEAVITPRPGLRFAMSAPPRVDSTITSQVKTDS
jgi:hypothetical protein